MVQGKSFNQMLEFVNIMGLVLSLLEVKPLILVWGLSSFPLGYGVGEVQEACDQNPSVVATAEIWSESNVLFI